MQKQLPELFGNLTPGNQYAAWLRRRQFIIVPSCIKYSGWPKYLCNSNVTVYVHPDLAVYRVRRKRWNGLLLGYAIDPDQPELTDEEVLKCLISRAETFGRLIRYINNLTGRFVLVLDSEEEAYLFHDAVGLRQVTYTIEEDGNVSCASQAETLAGIFNYTKDPEIEEFRKSWRSHDEFWLPNDRTPYREIRYLLPNHYINLKTGVARRFWPGTESVKKQTIKSCNDLVASILKNSIHAAVKRFELLVAISAGGDSRRTLAASREWVDMMTFFTTRPTQMSMLENDIRIPSLLLSKLGIKHHYIGLDEMDPEFKMVFRESATWARDIKGRSAYTILQNFGSKCTVMNSNISEVGQRVYWLPASKLNGRGLAILSGLAHPLAEREFQSWIDSAYESCKKSGIHLLDLFFLEQRMGRWAAAAFAEYDIVHETFNPYNNRVIHEAMLGVDERYRNNRSWKVLIENIKSMWPAVLIEPINPPDKMRDRIQQFIRRKIFHRWITPWFPIYEYLRYLKMKKAYKSGVRRQNSENNSRELMRAK